MNHPPLLLALTASALLLAAAPSAEAQPRHRRPGGIHRDRAPEPAPPAERLPRLAIHGGAPAAPLAVVVHGINPTPGDLDPLADSLARRGYRVLAFHYDDRQDLDRSAAELGAHLLAALGPSPQGQVTVVAHSMGGLVARRALTRGHAAGLAGLDDLEVTLLTVASPFGGFKSANWARLDLGIGPGAYDDLGTRSRFIRRPGELGPRVRHLKVETREAGRTVVRDGRRVDDATLTPAQQRNEAVDAAASARDTIALGHTEVVNDGGAVSEALRRLLDRVVGAERPPPRRARRGLADRL